MQKLYGDTISISHGFSYGMNTRYNFIENTYSAHCRKFEKKSYRKNDPQFPTIILTDVFADQKWDSIMQEVNISAIFSMKDRYGCPDCNDSGAEWITLTIKGESKEVVFPAGVPPNEITELIKILRRHDLIDW